VLPIAGRCLCLNSRPCPAHPSPNRPLCPHIFPLLQVIIGSVNLVSTGVAILLVDRSGRRALFLEGGAQMFIAQVRLPCSLCCDARHGGVVAGTGCWEIQMQKETGGWRVCAVHTTLTLASRKFPSSAPVSPSPCLAYCPSQLQLAVGILLGVAFGQYNTSNLPSSITYVALVLICIFVAGFAWSWGPLGWLVSFALRLLGAQAIWLSMAAPGQGLMRVAAVQKCPCGA